MRVSEPWRIGLAGAALAASLAGLVSWEGRARAQGQEVALPMEGVDPRGPLTGAYVRLKLREGLPLGAPCPPGTRAEAPGGSLEGGARGWIALRQQGNAWRVAGMAADRAGAERLGPVVVRGTAACFTAAGGSIDLDVGINRFHAAEAEAQAMEALLTRRGSGDPPDAYALVSVGRDGRARLSGVLIAGRRVELGWF